MHAWATGNCRVALDESKHCDTSVLLVRQFSDRLFPETRKRNPVLEFQKSDRCLSICCCKMQEQYICADEKLELFQTSSWLSSFRSVCFKTVCLDIPDGVLSFLDADGISSRDVQQAVSPHTLS